MKTKKTNPRIAEKRHNNGAGNFLFTSGEAFKKPHSVLQKPITVRLRSFKSRITIAFTLIFLACSIAIFFAAYLITSQSLENEERALLRSRLLEFWAEYQNGSVGLLRAELTLERIYSYDRPFTLRIADPLNFTLFIYPPPGRVDFPYASLETLPPLRDGDVTSLRNPANGLELTVAALRLPDNNMLEIGISNTEKLHTLARFRNIFLLILVPLGVVSVLGGLFFSSRFLSPVKKMVAGIKEIMATGDIRTRVSLPGPAGADGGEDGTGDELGELVRLFNGLLSQIETLVGNMRGTLDSVAHDVRTPLTRLTSAAENALAAGDEAAFRDALAVCLSEAGQVLSLLTSLLEISRAQSGIMSLDKEPVDLAALIRDMADLYSYPAGEKRIEIAAAVDGPILVPADSNRLRQVLSNLIENALRHSPADSSIGLSAREDEATAEVTVADSGDGIPPEDLKHIWERFYRGRNSAGTRGFGLGLSLARAIVEAHGGEIRAESEPGRGARFTFRLPK
ncbi:MAG: HAMP domain-containing histidine kinase [Spirochaetales bacterium]|nr:HAMP domain-containing histidine kinase [Spirochaetales bacterium]